MVFTEQNKLFVNSFYLIKDYRLDRVSWEKMEKSGSDKHLTKLHKMRTSKSKHGSAQ